eukprot:COSAG02_NODE_29729_length_564_cov_0.849462_1_plen_102_part_00
MGGRRRLETTASVGSSAVVVIPQLTAAISYLDDVLKLCDNGSMKLLIKGAKTEIETALEHIQDPERFPTPGHEASNTLMELLVESCVVVIPTQVCSQVCIR